MRQKSKKIYFSGISFSNFKNKKMNDLNLRFERTPSSRHMTYLKEQKQRRDADEGIMFAEGECMDNYYATRLSDWMNKKPGKFMVPRSIQGTYGWKPYPYFGG